MLSPFTQKFIFFLILPLVTLAFFALSNIQKNLHDSAIEQLKGHMLELVEHQASEITAELDKATAIANTTANIVGISHPIEQKQLYKVLESNLNQLPIIYGTAIAYEKNSYKNKKLFAPYTYHEKNQLKQLDISKDAYNYTDKQWQWWHGPRDLGQGIWTAPYFDKGAGNTLMVTYSTPFFVNKQFTGVSTIDIDLEKLHKALKLESLKEIQYIILTNTGHFAYHYKESLIGQSYIDLATKLSLNEALVLGKEMVSGKKGFYEIHHGNRKEWIFYAPIGNYGWSFAIQTSEEEAHALVDYHTATKSIWLLAITILGLALTQIVSKRTIIKPLIELKEGIAALAKGESEVLKKAQFSSILKDVSILLLENNAQENKKLFEANVNNENLQELLDEKGIQLQKNRRRLEGIFNAARNASIHIDRYGEILLANNEFKKLMRKSDLNAINIQAFVHDTDKRKLTSTLETVFEDLKVHKLEALKLIPFESDIVTCELIVTPIILDEGEIEASIIFLRKENV